VAIVERLERYLRDNDVAFTVVTHPEAYTSQETAAEMHVSGKTVAKAVILRSGDRYIMAVLPAHLLVDVEKLKKALGVDDLVLAREEEFRDIFIDCEPGAEPPFGNLYDVDTVVDECLTKDPQIFFNGGNHREAVEIKYSDYERLVKPKVADFCKPWQ